jgi:hypothetical protein
MRLPSRYLSILNNKYCSITVAVNIFLDILYDSIESLRLKSAIESSLFIYMIEIE